MTGVLFFASWRSFRQISDTVERGQHEIEHDHVVVVRNRKVQPRDAVGREVEHMAFGLEIVGDVLGDIPMILYDENTHGTSEVGFP